MKRHHHQPHPKILPSTRTRRHHSSASGGAQKFLPSSFVMMARILAARTLHCEWEAGKHAVEARRQGETAERIIALDNWRTSRNFLAHEKAGLNFVTSLIHVHNEADFQWAMNEALDSLARCDVLELLFATVSVVDWRAFSDSEEARQSKLWAFPQAA